MIGTYTYDKPITIHKQKLISHYTKLYRALSKNFTTCTRVYYYITPIFIIIPLSGLSGDSFSSRADDL